MAANHQRSKPASLHVLAPEIPTRLMVLAYLVLAAIALVPIMLVELPGLGDYLNHLARMRVIAGYDSSAELRALYGFDPLLRPYLAMDLIVPKLSSVMSIYDAGRVFIALAIVMPVLGVIALHLTAWGKLGATPALIMLFAYSSMLSWGFLNYLFAIGVALPLLALWLRAGTWPRWRRAAFLAVAATLIYFCHLLAFGAYCLGVAGIEFARAWRSGRGHWRSIALDWVAAAVQALPGALLVSQLDMDRFTVPPSLTAFGSLSARLDALASPFVFLGGTADVVGIVTVLAILALALLRRRIAIAGVLWPAGVLIWLLALVTPEWIDGTWGIHLRLPLVGMLILVAALNIRLARREQIALLAVVAAVTAFKAAAATNSLRRVERDIAEMRELVQVIPRGARVLVAQAQAPDAINRVGPWRMTSQMAMVALIERDAFVPFLFSGVPMVRPRLELLPLSTPHGHPLSRAQLAEGLTAADGPGMPEGDGQGRRIYWRDWPAKFTHLIWQHYGAPGLDHPALLEQVATGRSTTIYRIHQPATPK